MNQLTRYYSTNTDNDLDLYRNALKDLDKTLKPLGINHGLQKGFVQKELIDFVGQDAVGLDKVAILNGMFDRQELPNTYVSPELFDAIQDSMDKKLAEVKAKKRQ